MFQLFVGQSEVQVLERLRTKLIVSVDSSPNSDEWKCRLLDYSHSWHGSGATIREAINRAVDNLRAKPPSYLKEWLTSW